MLLMALRMVEQGAAIVDVGGESVRPGARRVAAEEQIERAVGVIEALRRRCDVLISIDTTSSAVAEAALVAGADIINDVSAGTEDGRILDLAAQRRCGIVLMHRLLPPEQDSYSDRQVREPAYGDVVADVSGGGFDGVALRSDVVDVVIEAGDAVIELVEPPTSVRVGVGKGNVEITLPPGSHRCELTTGDGEIDTTDVVCDPMATALVQVDVEVGERRLLQRQPGPGACPGRGRSMSSSRSSL